MTTATHHAPQQGDLYRDGDDWRVSAVGPTGRDNTEGDTRGDWLVTNPEVIPADTSTDEVHDVWFTLKSGEAAIHLDALNWYSCMLLHTNGHSRWIVVAAESAGEACKVAEGEAHRLRHKVNGGTGTPTGPCPYRCIRANLRTF